MRYIGKQFQLTTDKLPKKSGININLAKYMICGVIAGAVWLSGSTQLYANSAGMFTANYNLRLRTAPSLEAETITTVLEGSEVRVLDTGNGEWYRVEFGGTQGYMFSEFLVSTSTAAASEPAPFTATANVRMRTSPSLDGDVIRTVREGGTVLVLDTVDSEWHRVEFDGDQGYMFSEFLVPEGTVVDEPPVVADAAPVMDTAPVMAAPAEAAPAQSQALTEGSEYFVSGNVRLRTAPSLDADIIKTVRQSSTVEVVDIVGDGWKRVVFNGTHGYMYGEFLFDRSTMSTPVVGENGVELLHWSYVRTFLRTGVPIQITDVRTGMTYWVASFSNGNHADVEPVTAEDTAIMHSTYGGRWSWDTRPVWVHIDGRTIAASINGMPHAGSTNPNNNMNGHVCLHFYGSRTHNGTVSHERHHQASIQEALRAAR